MDLEVRIEQVLSTSPQLMQAVSIEPRVLDLLRSAAAPNSRETRWECYESLRDMGSGLVGWRSRHIPLRSPRMYEAFVQALDELLPDPPFDGESEVSA
jgi:hypothetical protein